MIEVCCRGERVLSILIRNLDAARCSDSSISLKSSLSYKMGTTKLVSSIAWILISAVSLSPRGSLLRLSHSPPHIEAALRKLNRSLTHTVGLWIQHIELQLVTRGHLRISRSINVSIRNRNFCLHSRRSRRQSVRGRNDRKIWTDSNCGERSLVDVSCEFLATIFLFSQDLRKLTSLAWYK